MKWCLPRPNQERLDLGFFELFEFWLLMFANFSEPEIRSQSLQLYNNRPLLKDDHAG